MDILYLSHCVPNPPDKGERIRAFHEVNRLTDQHRVHVACFARDEAEKEAGLALAGRCASLYIEILSAKLALARAAVHFALGGCIMTSFYGSTALRRHVATLSARVRLGASVIYSGAMAPYAPPGVPFVLDLVDVDSEKWLQYARTRFPGFAYRIEGQRLRAIEKDYALRSRRTFLSTRQELELFRGFAPEAPAECMENGVDFEHFDPARAIADDALGGRKFLAFVGVMDYFPNSDGVCRFASEVFPGLRRRDPQLEFFVVGRNPTPAVARLAKQDGITVTGSVDDVRPYLAAARAVVAPLEIARGIQNKVLEALAMGKRVFASTAICQTFQPGLPAGVVPCASASEYISAIGAMCPATSKADAAIREAARERYSWNRNLDLLLAELTQRPAD
jgi:sugar transferase (PEP-CTERM/EpsH1 system associated)